MSHGIAIIDGAEAMAYDVKMPWHRLGNAMGNGATVEQLLDAARLRYTVGSIPLSYESNGVRYEVPGHRLAVRFNADGSVAAPFGPVGENHTHSQNERNADILRAMEDMGCTMATGGALDDGQRVWMLAKMPDASIKVLDNDEVRGFFLLHWSHDGQSGITGQYTGIRVVCQNTLAMAASAGRGRKGAAFSIRHTSSVDARVGQAAKIMSDMTATLKATGETFAQMAQRPMGPQAIAAYIEACIPNPEPKKTLSPVLAARRDTIARLMAVGKGADMANAAMPKGTVSLWGAYNAVTEYFDHVRTAETKSPEGLAKATESAIFGANAETKAQALDIARQLVAA